MRSLHLAPGLALPVNAVTQVIGIVARRSGGKTHTATVLTEELLDAHCQVVVIDPQGVWWGLRSSKDGKSEGYSVVVFGGKRADVPLAAHMGAHVADVVAERGISVVLDLSLLSKTAERQFVTDFLERLYRRKAAQEIPTPMHVVIDEADIFAAQRLMAGDERMFSAVDAIVRRGRTSGFGVSMITQRPAAIHKNVLSQIELLIALQITAPQDRAAVEDWIEANASSEQKREFISSLPGMEQGDAWVWSPQWLKLFKRVHVRDRKTYDSSRTPTMGDRQHGPKKLAQIDVDKLRADMAEVVQEAEKNDPAKLKARIKELERELKAKPAESPMASTAALATAVAMRDSEWTKALSIHNGEVRDALNKALNVMVVPVSTQRPKALQATADGSGPYQVVKAPTATASTAPAPTYTRAPTVGEFSLGKGERRILIALAESGKTRTAAYVGIVAEYSSTSGTFSNLLSGLRTRGYLVGPSSALSITPAGVAALGRFDPLPVGDELVDAWCAKVSSGEGRVLRYLVGIYPKEATYEEVGQATGYSHTSGTFSNLLSSLRTLRLIEGRGSVKASAEIMGEE